MINDQFLIHYSISHWSLVVSHWLLYLVFTFDFFMFVVGDHQAVVVYLSTFTEALTDVIKDQIYEWYDNQGQEQ